MAVTKLAWWRKLAWNAGWWLPFLPDRTRRWLYRRVGGVDAEGNKINVH